MIVNAVATALQGAIILAHWHARDRQNDGNDVYSGQGEDSELGEHFRKGRQVSR